MTLKTGMLVGIVGSGDIGVLIQIRASSNTCVIKLNNGTLKKNVPLQDIEEAKDMSDTKEKKSRFDLVMNLRRWFPGKISKVHRDGTYDVEYFDGDIEKKMASTDVEAAKKDNKLEKFAVGDKVKARYKNGSKLFSGKISRVRSDGTYDIKYDDGDVETRVARDLIEPNSEEKDEVLPTKKSSGFRVGQSVKARYKGGKKLFPGKIKRIHSDKTYDIMYEDGDEEKRVKTEYIESADNLSDEDIKSAKTSSKTFKVGQKVKAHYKKGKRLFPGKISRVRSDGTYDIDYDDGRLKLTPKLLKSK
ncbi:hypothetical protein AM588_10009062 [Phytophthora nicotianae]|uniref:Tudor domain-containing protein n=1 Tax=Phytophthora nicotianae TaxID=4792 RepID=A0A0W8DA08_PHYNI|nr:hypothetical protein AM588_10009062 [Phytophthora nicotianae]